MNVASYCKIPWINYCAHSFSHEYSYDLGFWYLGWVFFQNKIPRIFFVLISYFCNMCNKIKAFMTLDPPSSSQPHNTHATSRQVRLQRKRETKNIDTQCPPTSRPFLFSVCLNMNDKHLMKYLAEIWTWLWSQEINTFARRASSISWCQRTTPNQWRFGHIYQEHSKVAFCLPLIS